MLQFAYRSVWYVVRINIKRRCKINAWAVGERLPSFVQKPSIFREDIRENVQRALQYRREDIGCSSITSQRRFGNVKAISPKRRRQPNPSPVKFWNCFYCVLAISAYESDIFEMTVCTLTSDMARDAREKIFGAGGKTLVPHLPFSSRRSLLCFFPLLTFPLPPLPME